MTNTVLKAQIDSQITNETTIKTITPTKVGVNLKAVVDYVDQEVSANSGTSAVKYTVNINQANTTPVPLTEYFNILSYNGGYSYLPIGTKIGQEVIVATANNTNIHANAAIDPLLMQVYGSPVSIITMTANQVRRFIYIGLGTGEGGLTDGYWLSELMS